MNLQVLPPKNQPDAMKLQPLKKAATLPNLWWKYQQTKEPLRQSSRDEYYAIGRLFTGFFENRKFAPEEFLAWHEFVRSKRTIRGSIITIAYVNKINAKVRGFLRWLYQMQYVSYDLGFCIPHLPDTATKQPVVITEEQFQAIKKWCQGRAWAQPHLWLVILGYRTGMSLVDCCYLRWKDVHLDDDGPSWISIIRWKMATRAGEKARCQIPIIAGTDLHEWILERRKVHNYKRYDGINDYVHQDCPGLYEWTGAFNTIHNEMRRIFNGAGIPKGTTFKNLRNALCSNLVNSGMNLALVCKITGHNDPKTLMTYLKPDRLALQDGMAKAYQYAASQLETINGVTLHETTTETTDGQGATGEDNGRDKTD